MLARICPMRLRLMKEPVDHPDYLFEIKHGGFRALVYLERPAFNVIVEAQTDATVFTQKERRFSDAAGYEQIAAAVVYRRGDGNVTVYCWPIKEDGLRVTAAVGFLGFLYGLHVFPFGRWMPCFD
jgi:hypothetical protein